MRQNLKLRFMQKILLQQLLIVIHRKKRLNELLMLLLYQAKEMKGRIIGREGRNIKAIENATGVELIIDDTPEAITISCFDPIRREIARLSLETLIRDGRIQPGRIEEVVQKTKNELHEVIQKTGEDAIF